jgi:hypothetical protein
MAPWLTALLLAASALMSGLLKKTLFEQHARLADVLEMGQLAQGSVCASR